MGDDGNDDLHELEENAEDAFATDERAFLRKLKRPEKENETKNNGVGVGKLISSSALSWLGFFRVIMLFN